MFWQKMTKKVVGHLMSKPNRAKNPTKENHIYLIYMYKEDLALNDQQWFIYHKTQQNQVI